MLPLGVLSAFRRRRLVPDHMKQKERECIAAAQKEVKTKSPEQKANRDSSK